MSVRPGKSLLPPPPKGFHRNNRRCACGSLAVKLHSGSPACQRCVDIESWMYPKSVGGKRNPDLEPLERAIGESPEAFQ